MQTTVTFQHKTKLVSYHSNSFFFKHQHYSKCIDASSLQHKCYKTTIIKEKKKYQDEIIDILYLDINIHTNKGKKKNFIFRVKIILKKRSINGRCWRSFTYESASLTRMVKKQIPINLCSGDTMNSILWISIKEISSLKKITYIPLRKYILIIVL